MRWLALLMAFFPPLATASAPLPLSIVSVVLHQFEDGPSVPPSFTFGPGETVFVSFQVAGFQTQGEDKVANLQYRLEAVDAAGVRLVEPMAGKVHAELAPEDKDWKPTLRWDFALPPLADSGSYKILMWVKDLVGGQEARKETMFSVQGRKVEASDTLVVRNLRFLRGEEDSEPLPVASYRPGDTVWARLDITGYKIGEKNLYQVEYDISVLSPSGKALFTQKNAAVEKEQPFYPKRYVPGILSLNLTPTIKPGEYTIVLSVRDGVGNQAAESRHSFRVE
jgi:hypothetical protein